MSFLFGVLGQVQFKADSDLLRLILDYSACFREPVACRDGVTGSWHNVCFTIWKYKGHVTIIEQHVGNVSVNLGFIHICDLRGNSTTFTH